MSISVEILEAFFHNYICILIMKLRTLSWTGGRGIAGGVGVFYELLSSGYKLVTSRLSNHSN